jgi:anti-sigma regulatory factor (Ser/Thr protein kinase)
VTDEPDDLLGVLQDVVLPAGTPVLRDVDLAAHLSVADDPGEAAGAWFDVVVLSGGKVAITVGQAPGDGVAAAMAARAVSSVLRAGLLCHEDARVAVDLADLYAGRSPDARSTTAAVVLLDPRRDRFGYVVAGQPGPVVVPGAGRPRLASSTTGGPLGSGQDPAAGSEQLGDGDLVVLSGTTELSSAGIGRPTSAELLDGARGADALATVVELARRGAGWQARGAVVHVAAQRRTSPVADLEVRLDVDDTTSRRARQELAAWLDGFGAPEMGALSLVHAAAELVTNVVDHAYADRAAAGGAILRASLSEDGVVTVDVVDDGRWLTAAEDATRGRGLAMAAGLVDDLSVSADDDGTCVRLTHRLVVPFDARRPADVATAPASHPLRISHSERGSVAFSGVLGHDDADEVLAALMMASRGGTVPVTVDLLEVDHLSTGGVRVLAEAVEQVPATSDPAAVVTLRARRGSVPQVELERAGIAHHVG